MRKFVATTALFTFLAGGITSAMAANIVETAAGAGQFNTLLAAAKAAEKEAERMKGKRGT